MRCMKLAPPPWPTSISGKPKTARLGGEDHVATSGEHAARSERRALHRRDDRLRTVQDAEEAIASQPVRAGVVGRIASKRGLLLDVRSGAEDLPFRRQHDRAHVRIRLERVERRDAARSRTSRLSAFTGGWSSVTTATLRRFDPAADA